MSEHVAEVFVSWGMWVAECPRDGCLGSEHLGHAPVTGHVGGLTAVGFKCGRCGLVCRSSWPDNAEDIWYLLSQRPAVETRSWRPPETLADLLVENALHGIVAAEIAGGRGVTIVEDRFADRQLAAAVRRQEIGV